MKYLNFHILYIFNKSKFLDYYLSKRVTYQVFINFFNSLIYTVRHKYKVLSLDKWWQQFFIYLIKLKLF